MYQREYYIDKASGTFADNLAAFGLAYVLNAIADGRTEVRLEDAGYAFCVTCEPAIQPEWVATRMFFASAPYLKTLDNKSKQIVVKGAALSELPPDGDTAVNYQEEKLHNEAYFAWFKVLPKETKRRAMLGELSEGPNPPRLDWDLFRAVNPAALQAYNGLVFEWERGRPIFAEMLKVLLRMTAQSPNDVGGAEAEWIALCKKHSLGKSKDATASQLLNPIQGKGVNNAKAEWRDPNNLKGFWLLELLKLVGLRNGGITKLMKGTKDRKTYALIPVRLGWQSHHQVMTAFQRAMAGSDSAVKLDCLAALRYTQALLKHYEDAREGDAMLELVGRRACDLVSGLHTAFYKSLGNSAATMNIASIGLPTWVRVDAADDLPRLTEALDEHVSILRNLDEGRGEQFNLLLSYRDFMSGGSLDPFFKFTTAYSGYLISQRERGKFARAFSTTTLEILFMNSDTTNKTYVTILKSGGFKNVASAIRRSTVMPQRIKGMKQKPAVEIRYGLGQHLTRKAAYPDEFLAELSEFMHLYNAENAQYFEKRGKNPFRKNLTTKDVEEITSLVDQFGSKVVCNMLVAFGYASEAKEDNKDDGLDLAPIEPEDDSNSETEGDE